MFRRLLTLALIEVLCSGARCFHIRYIIESKRSQLDPEIFLNTTEILQKYNYQPETHYVYTEDGFELKLFRVRRSGPPVVLVHGIGDSSDGWVVAGPKYSLAFLLADAGYDVWLFNCRGNRYSRGHTRDIPKEEYWDFSFEEIGALDLPATVDYVLSATRSPKLTYVGYSQGSTTFLVLCSLRPEYNRKIDQAVLLAPVAWLVNIKHPLVGVVSRNIDALSSFFKQKKIYELANRGELNQLYHAEVCNVSSPLNTLCLLEISLIFGLNSLTDLVSDRLPIITTHTAAGFSTKTLLHFVQAVNSKRFCRFDYGEALNLRRYSSPKPPDYDVSRVTVPMTMFVSESDWFASPEDVKILRNRVRGKVRYIPIDKSLKFTHLEFIFGSRMNDIVNGPVLEILNTLR
ncbi:lipase 1-like [Aricia agestis]|uniref:lipase 1-like n=1 Tax=Aricia agestis TaxID=91739 RepID=UPI001C209489|nr:lipase 1-like [Aricia agestis]